MAAQALMQGVAFAKQHRLASKGLKHLSNAVSNKTLKKILGGGSKMAAAIGFGRAMGTSGRSPYKEGMSRKHAKKYRASRAGVGAASGANTVGAGNAPVQFARTDQLKPYFRMTQGDCEDSVIVHTVDYVGQTGNSAAAGAWSCIQTLQLSPSSAVLHPWLSGIAPLFQRYKLKFLRLHYQHFTGTATPGLLVLQYFPNAETNSGTLAALTQTQSQNSSNFMTGALYEDFFHTADLHGIDPTQWYDTQLTQPAGGDLNSNFAGLIGVFTASTTATTNTGNFWVEAVYELSQRKLSSINVGLSQVRRLLEARIEKAQKLEYMTLACAQMIRSREEEEEVARRAREDPGLAELLGKLRVAPAAATAETPVLPSARFLPEGRSWKT